jgi:hypothetical protein
LYRDNHIYFNRINNQQYMKLSQLKTNPSNPRIIRDEKFKKLVMSIESFPKMLELRPIVYNPETMEVLGGNMRLKALQELKYKEIPDKWIKSAESLTEEEKKRFIIEDNVGFGEWDYKLLENNWDKEQLEDWGIEFLGEAMANEFNPSGESEQLEMKYPITIIMNEDQFNRWLAMKETVNENNDNKAFFKIVDIDLK